MIGLALMALVATVVAATTMLRGAANDAADPRSGAPAVRDVSAQRHAEGRKCSTSGRTPINGLGLGSNATAAWFGLAAGVIRPAELLAGRIDHALFAQIKCTSGESVYPAHRRATAAPCERFGSSNTAAPPIGARFVLDLSADEIARLEVPAWKKTIFRALARYGMIVGDTNGGNAAWGLQVESGSTYTSFDRPDPWRSIAKELGAERYRDASFLALDGGIDWARHLRQVDPCVSRGSC